MGSHALHNSAFLSSVEGFIASLTAFSKISNHSSRSSSPVRKVSTGMELALSLVAIVEASMAPAAPVLAAVAAFNGSGLCWLLTMIVSWLLLALVVGCWLLALVVGCWR